MQSKILERFIAWNINLPHPTELDILTLPFLLFWFISDIAVFSCWLISEEAPSHQFLFSTYWMHNIQVYTKVFALAHFLRHLIAQDYVLHIVKLLQSLNVGNMLTYRNLVRSSHLSPPPSSGGLLVLTALKSLLPACIYDFWYSAISYLIFQVISVNIYCFWSKHFLNEKFSDRRRSYYYGRSLRESAYWRIFIVCAN